MSFSCQRNSYLKEFQTCVKTCLPAKVKLTVNGKKETLDGFEVVLEDTILFPEGGGQPDDRGTINGVEVLRVVRRGAEALHFVRSPLEPGQDVELQVDWTRRFDHMQQHTGQHLITAVIHSLFGFKTTSWNLAGREKISFIELDTPDMSLDQMKEAEDEVNAKIRSSLSVHPKLYPDKNDPELKQYRGLGLPDDHVGAVRVLTIDGVDSALCCGTHVCNLSHLQSVKLLSLEKGKKNKTNLYFLVGNRILSYLGRCYDTEKSLTQILSGPPEQHAELAEKLVKSYKQTQKTATGLLREIAGMEAMQVKQHSEKDPVFCLHRKDGDNEFMNIISNELANEDLVVFLTVGEEKGAGLFLLAAKDEILTRVSKRVGELLEAKGVCKNGQFQGKAKKLVNRKEVERLLRETLCPKEA
ncbi:alanyl-tRNA editing protein Aarsd1-like [Liolophura sinensis]|uniref:alanyl-tRNA editing protein Aarsd1-like n=1 Tax=Liolophura sinensis TaxID=3198878 RepID=UPI003158B291